MTVTGQPAVTYGYDDAHRLTSITQGTSVVAFTYDDANRRSTLTYPNGILATYGYDNANQLTSLAYTLNGNPVGDLTYTYDAVGQRTSVGGSFARTGLPQALASATYDAGNRIATWGGQIFSYDLNGNLGSDGLTSYTWNARNQLAGLSGAASASFAYDATGQRRARTTSGTTSYLYDGVNAAQELVAGTATANVLTGGIDEVFQRTDSAGTRAVLTDALGSTVALVDGSGAVQTQYTYEPFVATSVSGTTSANPAQFTSRENDGTGLYYYRARYFDPRLQRFISEDPIGFGSGDVNLHAYVSNAPTLDTDPTGQITLRVRSGTFPSCEQLGRRKDPSWWNRLSCNLELGQVLPGPAAIFGPEEGALIQLAKEARQLGGVTEDAANTLLKWAEELGLRTPKGIEIHPGRNFDVPHIRIGPINHIPVK